MIQASLKLRESFNFTQQHIHQDLPSSLHHPLLKSILINQIRHSQSSSLKVHILSLYKCFNEFFHVHCHFQEWPLISCLFDLINHQSKALVKSIRALPHKDRFVNSTWKEVCLCLICATHHFQDQKNARNHIENSWYHQQNDFYKVSPLHIAHHLNLPQIPNDADQCYWYVFAFDNQSFRLHFLRLPLSILLPLLQRHSFCLFIKEEEWFLIDNQILHQKCRFGCSFNHHQWNTFYLSVMVKLLLLFCFMQNWFNQVKARLILNFD